MVMVLMVFNLMVMVLAVVMNGDDDALLSVTMAGLVSDHCLPHKPMFRPVRPIQEEDPAKDDEDGYRGCYNSDDSDDDDDDGLDGFEPRPCSDPSVQ